MASFTVFGKFAETFSLLDDEEKRNLAWALVSYGLFDEVPEGLGKAESIAFSVMREEVQNSKDKRAEGRRGGRPKKDAQPDKTTVAETPETMSGEPKKPVVSENEKPVVSENAKPRPDQTRPNQTRPDQGGVAAPGGAALAREDGAATADAVEPSDADAKPKRRSKPPVSRKPPTPAEVESYCAGRGEEIDGERFCDFYASKGWRVGNAPMTDWKAAARNWAKRDREERAEAERKEGGYVLPKAIADCIEWA